MAEGVSLGSAYGLIRIDLTQLKTNLQEGGAALRGFQADSERAASAANQSFKSTKEGAKALGMALGAVAAAGSALLVSATLTAARTQVLGTVLHQVGKNAGYSAAALDQQVEKIKKLGITTQEARTALVRFMQSELDVADAAKLARAAQDLAVIAGQNSSQAYTTLTQAIVAQETMLLRQYGIVKGLADIYGAYAAKHKLVASALDETQKKQAFLDAILESGAAAAGTYEAAMGDVGKQLTSLPRYTEEAKNALGEGLLPVMGVAVGAVTGLLKAFINLEPGMKTGVSTALAMGTAIASIGSTALVAGPKIAEMVSKIAALGTATLGVVGAAALIVTAVVSLVAASKAAAAAHQKESAEAAASSETYSQYRRKLDEAGASAYGLSEALYELVQAQEESRRAKFAEELVKAQGSLEGAALSAANFGEGIKTLVANATNMQLIVLQDRTAVLQLGTSMGITGDTLIRYAANVMALAAAEEKRRVDLANEIELERNRAAVLTEMMQAEEESTAIVSDHGAAMRKLSDDYMAAERSAVDLARETGLSVQQVKKLRDEAGYTSDEIKAFADDMRITGREAEELAKSTGLSVEEVRRLNSEFGMGAGEIRDYAEALREQEQAAEAAADAHRSLISAISDMMTTYAELDPTSDDYEEKLADITLQLALKIAEQRGLLQEWAAERFEGPNVELFSDFQAVFDAIKNGTIDVDAALASLINQTMPSVNTALATAKETAQANKLTVDDLLSGDFQSDLEARAAGITEAFGTLGDDIDASAVADKIAAAYRDALPEAGEGSELLAALGLDTLPAEAETAFGEVQGSFSATKTTVTVDAQQMASNVKGSLAAIQAGVNFDGLTGAWGSALEGMSGRATAFKDEVIAKLREIVNYVNGMTVSASISWSASGGFAAGGMVPGPAGAPVAATVHGGEMILNPGQQATLARMFGVSQADMIRHAFGRGGGGGSGAAAGRQVHTEFHQHFGDVIVRRAGDAREFGSDFSYGAMYRLRAVGLLG